MWPLYATAVVGAAVTGAASALASTATAVAGAAGVESAAWVADSLLGHSREMWPA